jgi:hypothetical protein
VIPAGETRNFPMFCGQSGSEARLIKFVRGARQISGFAFALAQPPLYLFKYFEIEFRNKNSLKELLYQFSATCNFN